MPTFKVKKNSDLKQHYSDRFFKDFDKVSKALLECLIENDTEAFIEILDAYLQVNRDQVAKKAKMPRSTVQQALSKKGNPTLRTLARIVHASVA
jgi:DNA-binding phage protein